MSEADRERWDARYREGAYSTRTHPAALLEEWLPQLPRGRALDVACGAGRNALRLAEAGYRVDAIDISSVALERARTAAHARGTPPVRWIEADLETSDAAAALPAQRYDLIVLVRYVNSALMPQLAARLNEGGFLLCEQHLATAREDVAGPKNAAFRLLPNELLRSAEGLGVICYREGLVEDPDGRIVALAQLVACRGPLARVATEQRFIPGSHTA